MLTGQDVEKQIEGWKNRNMWSPTQRSGSNLDRGRNFISETVKEYKGNFERKQQPFVCPRFQGLSLCGRSKSVDYSGL